MKINVNIRFFNIKILKPDTGNIKDLFDVLSPSSHNRACERDQFKKQGNKQFMEKIIWNENLATGYHNIDFQHKILIGIINDLVEAGKNETEKNLWMDVVLDELRSYTKYHFSNEALLMNKFQYEETQFHSQQHADFIAQLGKFCREFQKDKKSISVDLFDYLKNWLINHIMLEDKKLGQFLIEQVKKDDIKKEPFP